MRVAALAAALLVLASVAPGYPHPGRLNEYGCHLVRTPYVYADGTVARVGEYHCHRALDAMKLDDELERLQEDPGDRQRPTSERVREHRARPPAGTGLR